MILTWHRGKACSDSAHSDSEHFILQLSGRWHDSEVETDSVSLAGFGTVGR